jgi:hypothetical protein
MTNEHIERIQSALKAGGNSMTNVDVDSDRIDALRWIAQWEPVPVNTIVDRALASLFMQFEADKASAT